MTDRITNYGNPRWLRALTARCMTYEEWFRNIFVPNLVSGAYVKGIFKVPIKEEVAEKVSEEIRNVLATNKDSIPIVYFPPKEFHGVEFTEETMVYNLEMSRRMLEESK